MEQKKCVDDYTIKEMYENFSIFEEKYSNIINDTYSFRGIAGDNFYSKLKFVKFLKEYKKIGLGYFGIEFLVRRVYYILRQKLLSKLNGLK